MKSLLFRMKSLLLGKKSSKAKLSQGREKTGTEEEVWLASKSLEDDLALDPTVSSDLNLSIIQKYEGKLEENQVAKDIPRGAGILVRDIRNADFQEARDLDGPKDPETIRLESAAIKTQAALRGYLARQAFWALKGIIKLQALVRGHLVRRQAVSTLYCMLGIVKIQALARGERIRHCDIGIQLRKSCTLVKPLEGKLVHPVGVDTSAGMTKLSTNAFPRTLLASSPIAMPLHLQYEYGEMNSVLNWLERWSASRFWNPVTQHKKVPHLKSQKKQANVPTVDTETGRPNPSAEKALTPNADSVSVHSEFYDPRRSMRKVSIPSADCVQENPQHELEKVKRNLRKVHNPIVGSTVQSEIENERLRHNLRKDLSSGQDALELMMETAVTEAKLPDTERTLEPLEVKEAIDLLQDDQSASELDPLRKSKEDCKVPLTNRELTYEDDSTSNETKKLRRRSWFQAKQGILENQLQSRSILPSYMAVTESAKAKLRGQSSTTSGQDGLEKHNSTRGHSLSSSTNKKTTSLSPRVQRPIQANVKGGNGNEKSPLSSGNGNVKVKQAEWRR